MIKKVNTLQSLAKEPVYFFISIIGNIFKHNYVM